jgi:hypothetical protein
MDLAGRETVEYSRSVIETFAGEGCDGKDNARVGKVW